MFGSLLWYNYISKYKERYSSGSRIIMPEPSREGYIFKYWKGSRYKAGQEYKVTEDHLFVAQWKKSTTPGNDDESNTENGIRTGDDSNILLWLTLMTLSLIALVFIVIHIRKKNE